MATDYIAQYLNDEITLDEMMALVADAQAQEEAEAEKAAKVVELDIIIEALEAELAELPTRIWGTPSVQFRLDSLIRHTAHRSQLVA